MIAVNRELRKLPRRQKKLQSKNAFASFQTLSRSFSREWPGAVFRWSTLTETLEQAN